MSEKTVATTVILTSVNHVPEVDQDKLLANHPEADDLDEVAGQLAGTVETVLAERVFRDADEIPVLDVNTEVYDEWEASDASRLAAERAPQEEE